MRRGVAPWGTCSPPLGAIDTPARERSAASVGRFGFLRLLGALRCQGLGLLLTRKRVGLFAGLQQGREDFRHVTHQLGILFRLRAVLRPSDGFFFPVR